MAREGLARGELSPGTQAERRAVRQRLDDLTREMVKAVRQVAFAVQGSGAARAGRDEYSR
jgi:hypothetical protein